MLAFFKLVSGMSDSESILLDCTKALDCVQVTEFAVV